MKEYRKRNYVKKKYHEYYINRIIRQAAEDGKFRVSDRHDQHRS